MQYDQILFIVVWISRGAFNMFWEIGTIDPHIEDRILHIRMQYSADLYVCVIVYVTECVRVH